MNLSRVGSRLAPGTGLSQVPITSIIDDVSSPWIQPRVVNRNVEITGGTDDESGERRLHD